MEWLQKLLSFDAPEHAVLQSAGLSLRGIIPWWAAVLVGVAAAAGVVFLYVREQARLGILRRLLMAGLRAAALGLLLLLLLRPVLVAEFHGERPRPVALLIDNSQSMTQRDQRLSPPDRVRVAIAQDLLAPDTPIRESAVLRNPPVGAAADPARKDLVRAVLGNPRLRLLDRLKERGPLHAFLFGQRLRSVGDESAGAGDSESSKILSAFTADETRTALADAVKDLLDRGAGDLPAAIVLMTDGRDNASKVPLEEAARECARLQVPLHIYGVGSPDIGNLQLKDIGVPDTLFYEDAVSAPVRWRSQGFKQGKATLTLTLGGKVVARRDVLVHEGEDFREVLTFTPQKGAEKEQKLDLTATIKYDGPEAFTDDNEVKRSVRLVDRKVNILYVENAPRWECKFLQTLLLRDRRVQAHFVLLGADPRAAQAGPPFLPAFPATRQELFAYDLLILGDVPADQLGTERLRWVQDFVREGGGLVLIAGRQHAPASYRSTPLAEVLPVEFVPVRFAADTGARPQPFVPVLTRVGRRSDLMALADTDEENSAAWKGLPGFYWHYPVVKLRPGAVALLTHPSAKAGDEPMPILASQAYGKGPVLFAATDETWRWRYNAEDRFFGRFWGQVVYKFGLPHLLGNPRRVQLEMERAQNVLGRPGYVYARLFDADYRPLRAERVTARLHQLDARPGTERGQTLALEAIPGQPGDYRALLANDAVGRFEVRIDSPEVATLEYRVSLPPQHELEVAGLAEDELRRAAQESGGRFYREEDLHLLPANVTPRSAAFTQRQEILLWNPLALVLFVGLVTAEWVLRRFSNLS
jgi:uncharacterized membrane protein